jgi:cholesterol transport system auxiliary component
MRKAEAMRPLPYPCRTAGALLLGLLVAATAGCVRFGAEPPQRLLAIESTTRLEPGKSLDGPTERALFIEAPNAAKAIDTQRVAVRATPTGFAYVKKALWVDTPAQQFQALLSEIVSARTDRMVLDPAQYPARAGHVLHGDLLEFGIDAGRKEAVVTYDATLLAADGKTVRRQRFSASRPVSKVAADTVAPAISAAANEVAAAVADWIKAN